MLFRQKTRTKTVQGELVFIEAPYWGGTFAKKKKLFSRNDPLLIPLEYDKFKAKTQDWTPEEFNLLFNSMERIDALSESFWEKELHKEDMEEALEQVQAVESVLGRLNWMKTPHPFSPERFRSLLAEESE